MAHCFASNANWYLFTKPSMDRRLGV